VNDIDLTTDASGAIDVIDAAINDVNTYRSDIGGFQNRLDYAISNVNAAIENTMASDSVIRDADIATEMAEMTKAQMLIQAGTSMLAQANLMPQNALALLP
jgi:flagellin